MADSLAGVVLAAGAGTRLSPLNRLIPKALCPVATVALVDHAIDRVQHLVGSVAVNLNHHPQAMTAHLRHRDLHLSPEFPLALGTAGALGLLREWIDGRDVLVTNADAWLPTDLTSLLDGWDGRSMRLLAVEQVTESDFGTARYCGAALMPWSALAGLEPVPSGLYETCWGRAWADGALELVLHEGPFVDCGTPSDYLAANLLSSGGGSVVDDGAFVGAGAEVVRSVVWAGATVEPGECLVDAIRTAEITVLVR